MAYLQDDKPEGGPYNWPSADEATVIGKEHERLDGLKKATGAAKYTYDINLKNQLGARALGCPHAHCKVVSIDSAATRMAFCIASAEEDPCAMMHTPFTPRRGLPP